MGSESNISMGILEPNAKLLLFIIAWITILWLKKLLILKLQLPVVKGRSSLFKGWLHEMNWVRGTVLFAKHCVNIFFFPFRWYLYYAVGVTVDFLHITCLLYLLANPVRFSFYLMKSLSWRQLFLQQVILNNCCPHLDILFPCRFFWMMWKYLNSWLTWWFSC